MEVGRSFLTRDRVFFAEFILVFLNSPCQKTHKKRQKQIGGDNRSIFVRHFWAKVFFFCRKTPKNAMEQSVSIFLPVFVLGRFVFWPLGEPKTEQSVSSFLPVFVWGRLFFGPSAKYSTSTQQPAVEERAQNRKQGQAV
jgi:hypothetical protein